MKLYIMRHGDAVDGFNDAARPLSAQGITEAENVGRFLARMREIPDVVCHSPLLRSRQTAEVAARVLGLCDALRECAGIAPDDDPEKFAREPLMPGQSVLVVTHQPFVSELASLLLTGGRGAAVKFTTGSIAGFERRSSFGRWTLRFHATAKAIGRL